MKGAHRNRPCDRLLDQPGPIYIGRRSSVEGCGRGPSGTVRLPIIDAQAARRGLHNRAMQNDPLSHGLWEMTAPPAPPTSPLQGEVRADVAVVGCGYTGLSTALHLAEAGAKVVALEAVEIGFGGAGRNVGLVNAGMWLAPDDIVDEARRGLWRAAAQLAWRRPGGSLRAGRQARHRLRACAQRHAALRGRARRGSPRSRSARGNGARAARRCSLLSREETAQRIGVDIYAGSLLDLRAGTIQPLAYARGLGRGGDRRRRRDPHPKSGPLGRAGGQGVDGSQPTAGLSPPTG